MLPDVDSATHSAIGPKAVLRTRTQVPGHRQITALLVLLPVSTPQFTLVAVCALVLSAALAWHLLHKPTIYLVDYIAQRPDDRWGNQQARRHRISRSSISRVAGAAANMQQQQPGAGLEVRLCRHQC
jgi:hypothetical protein